MTAASKGRPGKKKTERHLLRFYHELRGKASRYWSKKKKTYQRGQETQKTLWPKKGRRRSKEGNWEHKEQRDDARPPSQRTRHQAGKKKGRPSGGGGNGGTCRSGEKRRGKKKTNSLKVPAKQKEPRITGQHGMHNILQKREGGGEKESTNGGGSKSSRSRPRLVNGPEMGGMLEGTKSVRRGEPK